MSRIDDTAAAHYPKHYCGLRWTTGDMTCRTLDHICCLPPDHDGDHAHGGFTLPASGSAAVEPAASREDLQGLRDYLHEHVVAWREEAVPMLDRITELERATPLPFVCDGCRGLGRHWVARPPFPAEWVDCRACAGTGRRRPA